MATNPSRIVDVDGRVLEADMPLDYDLEDHPMAEPDDGPCQPRRQRRRRRRGRRGRRGRTGASRADMGFAIGVFFT